MNKKTKVAELDFKTAVKLGKLICPEDYELMTDSECLSVDEISKELGIHKNTIKRWIAESVFVDWVPRRAFVTTEFTEGDVEPYEALGYYVGARLYSTQYWDEWVKPDEDK